MAKSGEARRLKRAEQRRKELDWKKLTDKEKKKLTWSIDGSEKGTLLNEWTISGPGPMKTTGTETLEVQSFVAVGLGRIPTGIWYGGAGEGTMKGESTQTVTAGKKKLEFTGKYLVKGVADASIEIDEPPLAELTENGRGGYSGTGTLTFTFKGQGTARKKGGPTKDYTMPPPFQAIVPLDVKISKRQVTLTAKPDEDKGTKWQGTLTAKLRRGDESS